jgi:hypothetical protein
LRGWNIGQAQRVLFCLVCLSHNNKRWRAIYKAAVYNIYRWLLFRELLDGKTIKRNDFLFLLILNEFIHFCFLLAMGTRDRVYSVVLLLLLFFLLLYNVKWEPLGIYIPARAAYNWAWPIPSRR